MNLACSSGFGRSLFPMSARLVEYGIWNMEYTVETSMLKLKIHSKGLSSNPYQSFHHCLLLSATLVLVIKLPFLIPHSSFHCKRFEIPFLLATQ